MAPKTIDFTVFKGSNDGRIHKSTSHKEIKPNQVVIQVTHSGLCGSDVHYKSADMVLGHEGVGIVKDIGENVKLFKAGDRVGWGYQHSSCGHCKQCLTGLEVFCAERAMYGFANLDQGSMAEYAVWNEEFVFKIPDALSLEDAAPLMCGGATVYGALQQYPVKSGERVGVVGVGGLGHLAIQYAAKMGCQVVVFSGTDSKRDEAMSLGAREFYATKGIKKLDNVEPVDRLIVTSSAQPDWSLYLSIMAPTGSVYPLSVSNDLLEMPYMPILLSGLRVQGSIIAARQLHREMLEFSAVHNIKPIIQKFPLTQEGVEKAFSTLEDGKMRYRGVLVA